MRSPSPWRESSRSERRRWSRRSASSPEAISRRSRSPNGSLLEFEILIIDEPTVGIDIKTKTAIHELIAEITRGGVSVLLISSDMPEMITLADRILVMRNFSIAGAIENNRRYEPMSRQIMSLIHGVEAGEGANAVREAANG